MESNIVERSYLYSQPLSLISFSVTNTWKTENANLFYTLNIHSSQDDNLVYNLNLET